VGSTGVHTGDQMMRLYSGMDDQIMLDDVKLLK
jgi:hypothetical protein